MNFNDRDRKIDSYLGGRMSHAEEVDFLRKLASDKNLQQTVEAEHSIRQTLQRDRDRIPADDPALRANVMGMLATLSPAVEPMASAAVGAQETGVASHGFSLVSGGVIKGVVAAAAGLGLTVGALLMIRTAQPPVHPGASPGKVSGATASAVAAPRSAPVPPPVQMEAKAGETSLPAISRADDRRMAPLRSARQAVYPLHTGGRYNNNPSLSSRSVISASPDSLTLKGQKPATVPVVITSDTMRVNVTIDLGKLK